MWDGKPAGQKRAAVRSERNVRFGNENPHPEGENPACESLLGGRVNHVTGIRDVLGPRLARENQRFRIVQDPPEVGGNPLGGITPPHLSWERDPFRDNGLRRR